LAAACDWRSAAVAAVLQNDCLHREGRIRCYWAAVDNRRDRTAPSRHHILERGTFDEPGINKLGAAAAGAEMNALQRLRIHGEQVTGKEAPAAC